MADSTHVVLTDSDNANSTSLPVRRGSLGTPALDIGKLSAAAVLLALGLGCVVYLLYHFWGGGQE